MENATEDSKKQQEQQEKKSNELTIEIRRFQNLLEILKSPKKLLLLSFAIAIIGILLFGGITLIVLSIKRLYPYNDITTNAMGTTTLRSENKDVSYFLLNSAELWANSGIKVKEGQTITIKSSGKKHSAVHHLVKDALSNTPGLRDPWVGAEGFPEDFDKRDPRDRQRARYRIFPNTNQDILLMQIVSKGEHKDKPSGLVFDCRTKSFEYKDNEIQFFVVGDRMDNIHINNDGVLYFAINDIVLDEEIIIRMMLECGGKDIPEPEIIKNYVNNAYKFREQNKSIYKSISLKFDSLLLSDNTNKTYIDKIFAQNDTIELKKEIDYLQDELKILSKEHDSICPMEKEYCEWKKCIAETCLNSKKMYQGFLECIELNEFDLKEGMNPTDKTYGGFHFGNGYGIDKNKIELYGYFMNAYKDAWYEDNVGSFLILVETKTE